MKSITVKKSASLATIARDQGFSDWRTIRNANHDLRSMKGDDLIDAGTKLSIPLKKEEYDHLIKTIQTVKQNVGELRLLALQDIDQAKRKTDWWKALDVLALVTPDGYEAMTYRNIVRRQHLEKGILELWQGASSIVGRYEEHGILGKIGDILGAALAKNSLKQRFGTLAKGTAKEIEMDVAKKGTEWALDHTVGEGLGLLAELILEFHPTAASKFGALCITGESPDHAYKEAKNLLTVGAHHSDSAMTDTIANLSQEKERAYGKETTGANEPKSINSEDFTVSSSVSTVTTQ